jgi:transposase
MNITLAEIIPSLLPSPEILQLNSWELDKTATQIAVNVTSVQNPVRCPVCLAVSHRIHSQYRRKLSDLSWANFRVTLQLNVRKFFCINPRCLRRIFAERITDVAATWARKTQRLTQHLTAIGLSLAGNAGVRLSQYFGFKVSRNTLLNLVRIIPLAPIQTPRILGVDDFAFRKRHTYGSILVDLEKSQPIAILKDREAETLADWLKEHPGVEIVSRDRSRTYEKGVLQGAPNAIQVADRFHILQNLAEALAQVFGSQLKTLKEVEKLHTGSPARDANQTEIVPLPPASNQTKKEVSKAIQRRERRVVIHQQVWELRCQGLSGKAIAKKLGIGCTTVFRYLRHSTFLERNGRSDRGHSKLDPYKDYLLEQWNQRCYDTKKLFEDIQKQGYSGSYDTVARYTRRLREATGVQLRQRIIHKPLPQVVEPLRCALTPRKAAGLVMQKFTQLDASDQQLIILLKSHSELGEVIEIAQDFTTLVRQRNPKQLDEWLERAINSNISPIQRFAVRLREDYDSVKAGVTLSVSNGPVEGHINRLKMLKRQMYGRASIDLLSRRFLIKM